MSKYIIKSCFGPETLRQGKYVATKSFFMKPKSADHVCYDRASQNSYIFKSSPTYHTLLYLESVVIDTNDLIINYQIKMT